MTTRTPAPSANPASDFAAAFPNSRKVYVEHALARASNGCAVIRVPMREVALTDGEPAVHLYDTSGPQGSDPRQGLPALRREWILARSDVGEGPRSSRSAPLAPTTPAAWSRTALRGTGAVTQLHYARQGAVTPEMEFIAIREGLDPGFVRSEVARGRAIIPANINHPESEPMIIGRNFL